MIEVEAQSCLKIPILVMSDLSSQTESVKMTAVNCRLVDETIERLGTGISKWHPVHATGNRQHNMRLFTHHLFLIRGNSYTSTYPILGYLNTTPLVQDVCGDFSNAENYNFQSFNSCKITFKCSSSIKVVTHKI